jgi:predicted ATPase/class 3 adenylate cyclase
MVSAEGEEIRGFDAGTVIFLFTDIEGSTRLWQEQPEAMREALGRHHALLQAAISGHGGHVFQIVGDGFCAAFGTAPSDIAAALDAQRALEVEPWGSTGALRVRMALHAGPAAQSADASAGGYASGLTLSHASRLLVAAHGGQVLLSTAARGLVDGALPDGAGLRDLGAHRLRDLPYREHIYQLTAPGLIDSFPPLRTADSRTGNLPVPLTSFIGRQRELAELAQILDRARLLTLTGSGGTGKTRLALQLARELEPRFADGAWLVELAPLTDPALMVQLFATALGLREQPGRPLMATLKDALATAEMILLLDNCEHLLDASAVVVADLLQSAPLLVVVTTSREPLAVPGEVTYRVASLSLPDPRRPGPAEELMRYEAVRLFVERAQAAQPAFRLTDANAAPVARICRRVDGIPLALELAATRARTLSADQIAARLDDYFNLLTGGSRSALPRQQTLRALIDWSYDLLSEPERALLRRLSVFSGGWSLEAAEAVGGGGQKPGAGSWISDDGGREGEAEADVLETLARLVDRSLVIADMPDVGQNAILPYQSGEPRYRLLEMIRQYAREKLLASGEPAMVRDRHLAFFTDLAAAGEPALHQPDQAEWLARLDAELDNLRAAMAWAMGSQPIAALRIASHLREFWTRRGLATEGRRWLNEALQQVREMPAPADGESERTLARGRGLIALATLLIAQGEYGPAFPTAGEGVELTRKTGNGHDLILPLAMFAFIASMSGHPEEARSAAHEVMALPRGRDDEVWVGMTWGTLANLAANVERDYDKARAYLIEGREIAAKVGDAWAQGMVTFSLGALAYSRGDYPEAQARFLESLTTWQRLSEGYFTHLPTSGLADVARQTGDYDRAAALYRDMVPRWQQIGNVGAAARCIECLGFIAAARGDTGPDGERLREHAARLLGAAEAMREASAVPMRPEERAEYDQVKDRLLGADGRSPLPGAEEAWSQGRAMTRAQAVEYALCEDGLAADEHG